MHAYHRLTGDFPKRGYGNTLRTPGFPEDGPVLTGTAPRLGHPAAMQPRPQDGSIVERFGTWELLSLAYGQMAVVHSSLVASTQGREHSYMDAVVASEAVQQSDLLLFNGFETPEDFWNMEKGATSMPASDWTKDSPAMLDNANDQGEALYTAPEGDALLCLLARYWHAASMQFFGPWDSDETHNQFLYNLPDTPDVVQQMMEAPSSLMAILYDHAYHPMQIRATKSFFYKTLIANLPHEVQGIATISAGCTASSLNQFTGSAMLVVPPAEDNGQANVDLRPGFERISSASADELALIRLILQSHKGLKAVPFLQPLQEVCQLAYGALNADRLAADWQLLLCLCRIDKETDAVKLVQQWYLLNSLLRDRHISKEESDEVAERRCNEWMHPVDMLVLHRLGLDKEQPAAKLKALGAQFDREKYLLIFFWRKAMTIIGDDERVAGLQTLNASCQTPRNQFFISSILRGSKNPEEDFAAAAPILKKVLALYYADGTLDEKHINLLLLQEKKNGTTVLKINNATRLVVQEYLRGELSAYVRGQRAAFPDEEMDYALYLLPLTMAFQPEDAPLEYAVEHATSSRATRLLTQRECAQIHTALEQLDDKRACELLLCRYVVNAFRALDDDRLDALKAMVAQLGFHADEAVKALLENADGRYSVERITWLSDLCKQCNKATIAAARIAYAVKHLLTQSELLVDAECQFIAESFEKNKVPDKLQDAATSYFKARYEGVIAQRVSAEDLQTVIRLTQLNATPAAEKIIRGAAPQRLTHEQQKMLIGTGSQAIVQAWQEYMKSVLTTSADAGEEDLLPWFQDSCKLLRDKGCKSDDGFEDNQSVDYILRYALKQRKAPSSLAFGVLSRVAESGFCGKVQQVQKVYDELLKTGDAQAQTQAT